MTKVKLDTLESFIKEKLDKQDVTVSNVLKVMDEAFGNLLMRRMTKMVPKK